MKFKNKYINKIISSGLIGGLLLSSAPFSSFANIDKIDNIAVTNLEAKNTSEISYELLMGLMGIGVSFGLSLPQNEAEYWDYTNSLKKHLQIIDEEYLDLLDKSIKEWKRNNNKPDNEKEPFKIPYTLELFEQLKELFSKVGTNVSYSYQYVGNGIDSLDVFDTLWNWQTFDDNYYKYNYHIMNLGDVLVYKNIPVSDGTLQTLYVKVDNDWEYDSSDWAIGYSFDNSEYKMLNRFNPGYFSKVVVGFSGLGGDLVIGFRYDDGKYSAFEQTVFYNGKGIKISSDSSILTNPSIDYSPTEPSIEDDNIIIPSIPSIIIPGIETIPGYNENLNINPPFNVIMPEGYTESSMVEKAEESKDITDIENARNEVNKLPEGDLKEELQNRLDAIVPNIDLSAVSGTANLDVYIKSENMLSLSLDTNSVTFEGYSGTEPMEKLGAVNITVDSSLPYNLNAYMPIEIKGSNDINKIEFDVFNIKESTEDEYQQFTDTTTKIVLKEGCVADNDVMHTIDLKLDSNEAYVADVYKTVIKFEAEQK